MLLTIEYNAATKTYYPIIFLWYIDSKQESVNYTTIASIYWIVFVPFVWLNWLKHFQFGTVQIKLYHRDNVCYKQRYLYTKYAHLTLETSVTRNSQQRHKLEMAVSIIKAKAKKWYNPFIIISNTQCCNMAWWHLF